MISLLGWVTEPLHYEFMRRALVEVVVMGAVTGAIGCYVVLRGFAFMGDALSHAIFPGIALAFLLGQSIFLGAHYRHYVRVGDLVLLVDGPAPVKPGAVEIRVPVRRLRVFPPS